MGESFLQGDSLELLTRIPHLRGKPRGYLSLKVCNRTVSSIFVCRQNQRQPPPLLLVSIDKKPVTYSTEKKDHEVGQGGSQRRKQIIFFNKIAATWLTGRYHKQWIKNHLLGMLYDGEVFLGQHPVTILCCYSAGTLLNRGGVLKKLSLVGLAD